MSAVFAPPSLTDATGAVVDSHSKATATPQAATVPIQLQLRNGTVSFQIGVSVDANTYPFVVTGGSISAGICGAPWSVTGGTLGPDLRLDATRQGSGSCANTITIVGEYQDPPSWRGTYGFDGATSSFKHTTLFQGWGGAGSSAAESEKQSEGNGRKKSR